MKTHHKILIALLVLVALVVTIHKFCPSCQERGKKAKAWFGTKFGGSDGATVGT